LSYIAYDVEQTVLTLVGQIFAIDQYLSASGGLQLEQQVQQRGFTSPAGAHDGVELVFLQRQVQSLEDLGFIRLLLEFNVFEHNVSEFFQWRFDFVSFLEIYVLSECVYFFDSFACIVVSRKLAQ